MSLRLYLDDCAYSKRLYQILSEAPYSYFVVLPEDADLTGARDNTHFAYAQAHDLIIVTKNPNDFVALHHTDPDHPGIFAVYQDNDPRDMSDDDIVQAIQNIVDAAVPIVGAVHSLNRWRY